MAKHIGARVARRGHDQQCNHDDEHTGGGPVDADLVDEVQIPRPKGIHGGTHQHDGPETQHRLPLVGDVVRVEDGNGAENQLGAGEVDAQGDGPVADEGQPAVDEADHGRPAAGAQHGGPVVDAAGGGKDGADLGERGGDADGYQGHEHPAPEDGDGLAVVQRDVERRGEAKGHGHDGKRQAEDAHHAEISGQLALVAEAGEGCVGGIAGGWATGFHG